MADVNLEEIHDTLVCVALEAGGMIIAANPTDINIGSKLNSADIVTETDKAVETLISTRLTAAHPSILFMGEETYKPTDSLSPAPTFIIDPIDGTTNFIHSFPGACVSAGLAIDRKAAVGVVYNPYTDVLFSAIKGRGAWMVKFASSFSSAAASSSPVLNWKSHPSNPNAHTLPLSRNPPPLGALSTALVAIEWGSARSDANFEVKINTFSKLARDKHDGGAMTQGLRSLGSAALNLCAVAAGQLDVYWEGGCWAWDVCAGWCILDEAGGRMAGGNPGDEEADLEGRVFLAVRGAKWGEEEQMKLVKEFWGAIGEGNKLVY